MESKVSLIEENPQDKANILSRILLTWSFDLFKKGYKSGIKMEDLYLARSGDRSGRLGDRLEQAWQDELVSADRNGTKPSLAKAIVRTFWLEYMLWGLVAGLLFVWIWPLMPYTLGLFIEYFVEAKTPETYRDAHIYNFGLNLLSFGVALLMNHLFLNQGCVGMRVRVACCSLMYRKILKLNRMGLNKTAPGQLINLMSNDVNRFDIGAIYMNYLWVMPISVPVVCYLVWQRIAWATLAALAVMFLNTAVIQVYLSHLQGIIRDKIAKRTDERVKVMSELVSGVQVIKMYAWEKPFEKVVHTLRKLEVNLIIKATMIKGFSTALLVFTERTMLFAALVTFMWMGGEIRAQVTFSLAQYFNLLQVGCMFFPLALVYLAESKVSIRRIEEFLMLEEMESAKATGMISDGVYKSIKDTKHTGVVLGRVSAGWLSGPATDVLKNISLEVAPGEFIGVVGHVGSGKSSLLQLILGELEPSKGSVLLDGARVSYASQEPWLFVGSVRQNILFGLPYDRIRYKKVVRACALLRDFQLLPGGDSTLVGERGISLSGGQRARIGLARACYRQADVYLLDDPLSAVDTHVGKHVVTHCILGLLRHSTRILVTHQLHHLKSADKIVILRNGKIDAFGTFNEVSRSPLFEELIQEEEFTEENSLKSLLPQRTLSIQSRASTTPSSLGCSADDREETEEMAEITEEGKVSLSVYLKYFRAGGGWGFLVFIVIANLLAQGITSFSDLWLTNWMNIVEERHKEVSANAFLSAADDNFTTITPEEDNPTEISNDIIETMINASATAALTSDNVSEIADYITYIGIWGLGILGCAIFTIGRSQLFLWVCMRSSIRMHNQMFSNILGATMRFFDTNPSGRILNRFSKDMGIVDEVLPNMFMDSLQMFLVMLGILVMVAIVSPFMILTTIACGIAMCLWTVVYLNTAQAIKRVEGVTRSPVFSHVSATMAGLTTVRACGAQQMLRVQFDDKQDVHTGAWYLTLVTNACFGLWVALIFVSYNVVVAYIFLLSDDGTTRSGNVGLALSQGLILVSMVQHGVKQATEVISQMTCVERVQQYTSLPKEKSEGPSPPVDWPKRARLIFKDLYLRYDAEAEPVLKNLNIVIESGWKVGVVGRTGAGKSSLISALFRLAPIDGHVYIDDVDTGKIALKELRAKIAIIPQEPVLFSASLRYNMDPFDKYSDADIWKALEQVELKHSVASLSSEVAAGGTNFSAGQRQLLCLARAALANNKLLVLDEATANVDPNTDALIQKSIRKHFCDCTVITVAHRLHTVADSDRVIVMEAGQIVESGHPHELLQNAEGHFAKMVKHLGPASEQSLRGMAQNAHAQHISHAQAGESSSRF